jgi:hypothetical protein
MKDFMIAETKTFPIKPPPRSTVVICAAVAIIPIGDFFILKGIIPHLLWLNLLLNGGILALVIWLLLSLTKTRFEISANGLRIRGDMWGKSFAWSEIDVAKAKIVSFAVEPGLKPKWRTCGTALPGYGSGWYRLNDKSKALIFVSDNAEAVYIPTRKDFVVLLSAADNAGLLQALQQGTH